MKKDKLPDLETSLKEINGLVDKMEHSELSLEQALSNFGRGIELIKHCQKILQEAEQKIQLLTQNGEQSELKPFAVNKNEEDSV
jgi:exodeoxyribonuclease VII small subunit